jgi:ABC-type multidrug transport system permease subunit
MVTQRAFQHYWRSPPYIMAKLMLNIVAGLFIGFSFYKSPDDVAGLQNKVSRSALESIGWVLIRSFVQLFAVFMATVLAAPLSQQ